MGGEHLHHLDPDRLLRAFLAFIQAENGCVCTGNVCNDHCGCEAEIMVYYVEVEP